MNRWSYKKPTKEGWYYVNQGDVVTDKSIEAIYFMPDENGALRGKQDDVLASDYHHCYKFMPFDVEQLNVIGNE